MANTLTDRRRSLRGKIGAAKRYGRLEEMAIAQTSLAGEKIAERLDAIAADVAAYAALTPAPGLEDVQRLSEAVQAVLAAIPSAEVPR